LEVGGEGVGVLVQCDGEDQSNDKKDEGKGVISQYWEEADIHGRVL
jgi:hypothetical protein